MIPAKPCRRRIQFSLASLIWLMLCAAMASYGYREHCERLRLEQKLLPSPYYLQDGNVNYHPPGPEFKLTRQATAMKQYGGARVSSDGSGRSKP